MHWPARPETLHEPRLSMPSACKPTLTRPGGRIAMSPRSTTRATDPSRPRCTAWCSNTLRLSSHRPKTLPAPICRSLSKTSSTPSWSAASWRTGSCACAAVTAATTSWSRSAASAGGGCPSYGARRVDQTVVRLVDRVFRQLPAHWWQIDCPEPGVRGCRVTLHCRPRIFRHQRQQYGWDAAD